MIHVSLLLALALPLQDSAADLVSARAVFEANIRAIQERNREAYLATYLQSEHLLRFQATGIADGFAPLAEGTPATGSEDWPDSLVARGLELRWIRPGVVFGAYRYRARSGNEARAGVSERLFVETPEGWRIAVTSAFDATGEELAPPLALVGANVHAAPGDTPIEAAVVLVRNGRIETMGPAAETSIPEGFEVVDLTGNWIVPGWIDVHAHYSMTGWADGAPDALDVQQEYPYEEAMVHLERHPELLHSAFLGAGVTTVVDCGGYPWTLDLQRASVPTFDAPHVLASGPVITPWMPRPLVRVGQSQYLVPDHARAARTFVRGLASQGAGLISFDYTLREEDRAKEYADWLTAVGEEARSVGLPLVVRASLLEGARHAVRAGARVLTTSVSDVEVDAAFIDAVLGGGTFYCPTLTVLEGHLALSHREVGAGVEPVLADVAPEIAELVRRTPEVALSRKHGDRRLMVLTRHVADQRARMDANLAVLQGAGVPIVLGTDAGQPLTLHGPSVFTEAEAMRTAGLSDLEVLVAATRNPARALGLEDRGHLLPGASADLIVLPADPAEDISRMRDRTHVMRNGWLHPVGALLPGRE